MPVARIYQNGQVVLPKAVRESAGLNVGDPVVIEARGVEVVIRKAVSVRDLRLPHARSGDRGTVRAGTETDAAWAEHVADQFG